MANIQLYTGENAGYSQDQLRELDKPLDQRLVSTRKGGSGTLKYIEGHDAIDQAIRLFGYGQWGYRPLSCEQVVLIDPLTGEAVGIEYKAMVELTVRGALALIVDIGSQRVAAWNVEDQIMGRRVNDAKYNKKPVDESEFTPLEKKSARAVIVEAHEQAKKGAVTDALKRALRAYGNQFGNGLYGDGRVNLSVSEENTVESTGPTFNQVYNKGLRLGKWTKETFPSVASGILNGHPINKESVNKLTAAQLAQLDAAIEQEAA